MSGQGFQLFQGGVREMVETADGLVASGEVIPLEAPRPIEAQAPSGSVQLPPPRERSRAAEQPNQPVSPSDVLRLAKARVKELKAELRKMKSLQRELDELEQLLGRSKKTTPKNVRPLSRAV